MAWDYLSFTIPCDLTFKSHGLHGNWNANWNHVTKRLAWFLLGWAALLLNGCGLGLHGGWFDVAPVPRSALGNPFWISAWKDKQIVDPVQCSLPGHGCLRCEAAATLPWTSHNVWVATHRKSWYISFSHSNYKSTKREWKRKLPGQSHKVKSLFVFK